jgi:hypothetical protein
VFVSYAHEDEAHLRTLEKHLSLLKRQGLIETWHDRLIEPGDEWEPRLDQALESAGLVLLLVSPDFMASPYCFEREMERALERHRAGEARVVPVFVRPCDWRDAPFARLQGLPRDAVPVTKWSDPDEAWTNVAVGLRAVIERR